MVHLRDYQDLIVGGVRASFQRGVRSVCAVAPTGAGKTVIFSFIASRMGQSGKRVVILVHRAELLRQTHKSLLRIGCDHGLISAKHGMDLTHHVQVASVDTLVNRMDRVPEPDLVIVDEAHHVVAGKWRRVLAQWKKARVLGVTATPSRLDGQGLGVVAGGLFDELVMGPEVQYLIDEGFLCKPRYFLPPGISATGLHTLAGDYKRNEAAALMDKPAIIGDAVQHYARICGGRPAVVFTVTVAHAEHVAEQFRAAGFRFEVLDGNMDSATREDRVAALGDGRLHGLVSCDIVSEGFDLPVVAAAIFLRPTQSEGLYMQQGGRVLRPVYAPGFDLNTREGRLGAIAAGPKPHAIIIDHVGNFGRHGYLEMPREWSLAGRKKRKGDKAPPIPVKQCPACYCTHLPAPKCPACGHTYAPEMRQVEQVEGQLEEHTISDEEAKKLLENRRRRMEEGRARSLEDLIRLATDRGYRNPEGWARHRLEGREATKQKEERRRQATEWAVRILEYCRRQSERSMHSTVISINGANELAKLAEEFPSVLSLRWDEPIPGVTRTFSVSLPVAEQAA